MPDLAPIALFIFKRANHLQRTIRSLKRCDGFSDSRVIVFGDGPRNPLEMPEVQSARKIARDELGPNVEFHLSESNLGLSRSVIAGVTDVVRRFGRVIVIEDDLEFSRDFLRFLNAGLDRYDQEESVFQISGHMFNSPEIALRGTALFLPFVTTWGWASWRRAWDRFDTAATGWEQLRLDRKLRRRFNLDGCYDYSTMLERQMAGLRDSWGVRWYWSVFRHSGVTCFPPVSLVRNTGMDGSGTHGRGLLRSFRPRDPLQTSVTMDFPTEVAVSRETFESVRRTIWRQNGGLIAAILDRLRRLRMVRRRPE